MDEEAKKAHSSSTSKMNDLPFWMADYEYSLPYSSSALKQTFNRKLTAKWKEHWKKSLRYHQITKIDPTFPSKKYHQLVGGLTKAQASLITQLRIGHVQLDTFLHRIKKTAVCNAPSVTSDKKLSTTTYSNVTHIDMIDTYSQKQSDTRQQISSVF